MKEGSSQAKRARTGADRLVLHEPRRTSLTWFGLYGALAVACWVLGAGRTDAIRVLCWVFAALLAVFALLTMMAVVNRHRLVLTRNGLSVSAPGLQLEYEWSQIQGFYTFERDWALGRPRVQVGVDFREGEAGIFSKPEMQWNQVTQRTGSSTRVVKGHAGFLPSTYGLRADELVNLLEGWRRANR